MEKPNTVGPVPNPSPSHRRGDDTGAFVAHRRSDARHDPESPSHEFGDGRASTSVPFNAHVRRQRIEPRSAGQSLRTPRCPPCVQSHFTFPIVETTRYVATIHKAAFAAHAFGRDLFGNELFRPRKRSEGRTDRRTQHSPHPPEGRREHVFEPIGRSQTTSPMGFVAFRRNQRR